MRKATWFLLTALFVLPNIVRADDMNSSGAGTGSTVTNSSESKPEKKHKGHHKHKKSKSAENNTAQQPK